METNNRYEFDREQAYRLVAVTDRSGRNKVYPHNMYDERLHCVAVNFHYDETPSHGDCYRLYMKFVQNPKGLWCKRGLHTTTVWNVEETEKGVKLFTSNSVYTFEKAALKEVPFQDEANLIELYMSFEDNDYFGKGFYYDEEKKPHELTGQVHSGMFQDSVLVCFEKDPVRGCACRYFPDIGRVTFYDTLYSRQDDAVPMLIHNTGNRNLVVRFQSRPHTWTIKPGESKRIMPYSPEGADREEI